MGRDFLAITAEEGSSPEWVVLDNLRSAFHEAQSNRSRVVVFLEARYEWTGWEKFQRVVIFDFSGKKGALVKPEEIEWEIFPYSFIKLPSTEV